MTTLFLLAALAFLFIIPRLVGDESIGFGGVFEINDGGAGAYQVLPKVEMLGIPNETTGVIESKTLDLPNAVIQKLPSLKDGGKFTVKFHLINASWVRVEALRVARSINLFRVTVPVDTGTIVIIAPGFIETNAIDDLEAEKLNTVTTTIVVSGALQ